MVLFRLNSNTFIHSVIKSSLGYSTKYVHRCILNTVCRKNFKTVAACYSTQLEEKAPLIMKLSTPTFKSIITDDVKYLKNLFEENGFEIRIAGGAVRDLLLGNVPKDIDFATTATPNEMKDLFTKHEIRMINRKGESHGTVTPRINDANYEITTLRVDEITDGRHAVVKFTTNWHMDANRRDLTINAMFLDFEGNVYDYFNGVEDLKNRRVAFVGDPNKRIQEDYLRILRYFRFYGRIAEKPDNHEEETLSAIKANAEGLEKISGERICDELFKILKGNYSIELLKTMLSLGVGPYIGLPDKCNLDELEKISEIIRSKNVNLEPITILCALLHNTEDVQKLISRLKPSAECRELAFFIVKERNKGLPEQPLKYYRKIHIQSNNRQFTNKAILQYLAYIGDLQTLKEYETINCKFPINGLDVMNLGFSDQRQVGNVIKELQIMWIDSDCKLTREELIEKIPETAAKYVFVGLAKKRKK